MDVRKCRFARAAISVAAARSFASAVAAEWRMEARDDDVRLCVSGLVTNALLHGTVPGQDIAVRIVRTPDGLRVEVGDPGAGRPEARVAGPRQCSGRGLALVAVLADDCGVSADADGKTVWAVFKA